MGFYQKKCPFWTSFRQKPLSLFEITIQLGLYLQKENYAFLRLISLIFKLFIMNCHLASRNLNATRDDLKTVQKKYKSYVKIF